MYGIFILLASAFFYATYGIFSKIIGQSFAPFTQAWTRGFVTLLLLLVFGLATKQFVKIKMAHVWWYLLIGATSALSVAPSFYSFVYLHLGTALFIQYAATAVTGYLLGFFLLKEKITKVGVLALILVLLGLLMVYSGDINFDFDKTVPVLAAIAAGSLFTTWYVISKKVNQYYSVFQISTVVYVSVVVVNSLIALGIGERLNQDFLSLAWAANIGYGIAGFLGVILCVYGLKLVEAHKASLVLLSEVLFGVIFGLLLFGETLTGTTIIGGILIVGAISLPDFYQISLRKRF